MNPTPPTFKPHGEASTISFPDQPTDDMVKAHQARKSLPGEVRHPHPASPFVQPTGVDDPAADQRFKAPPAPLPATTLQSDVGDREFNQPPVTGSGRVSGLGHLNALMGQIQGNLRSLGQAEQQFETTLKHLVVLWGMLPSTLSMEQDLALYWLLTNKA